MNDKISPDAKMVVINKLREALDDCLTNDDYDSAHYIIELIRQIEKQ